MKLYLSSYRIPTPEDLISLIGKDLSKVKVVTIANAKDYLAELARNVKINETLNDLEAIGLKNIDEVDLRQYRNPSELKSKLSDYDFIWVMGGNTFCLMYEMKQSGFDEIIKKVLESGIVYGGESAGACVAGNSLKGIELADNPLFSESVIWDGLKLIDKYILPHADNVVFAEAIEETRKMNKDNPTLVELKDSEALVVSGKNMRVSKNLPE